MSSDYSNALLLDGDCIEQLISINQKFQLVIADPPYRMTKRGKSCRPNWMPNNMGENVFSEKLPDTELWLKTCFDCMDSQGHIYIFTNTIMLQELLNAATKVGFKLHNILVMIKDTGMPNRWYYKQTELLLFMRKGKARPINDYTSRDWFNTIMPKKSTGKLHITQKPLDVIKMLVSNSSNKGDWVLDPFMGSGTTGLACSLLGRNFVGVEINSKFMDDAKRRIMLEIE